MLFGANVAVIVPAYDEAPRIGRVLAAMPWFVDIVVVVDDASRDGTANAAERAGDTRVTVVRHAKNRGVGAAIVTGYREAMARTTGPRDTFAVMAGDGQMHPDDLERVVTNVARGEADYVKGTRFSDPDVARVMPLGRRIGGRVFSSLTSLAIGSKVTDSQCGYTAIARRACETLDLDGLYPGYGYPNDLLGQLAARRLRIAEVPVRPVYADEISRLKLRHLPRIGYLVARAAVRRARAERVDGQRAVSRS
jgi:glycosyltransferase involved in cell wall biosynthesis